MQESEGDSTRSWPRRIAVYLAGIVIQCFGIVLCVKCGLGVSPINSIPYVGSHLVPLTLGNLTVGFCLVNMAIELVLSPRREYGRIALQLPVSFAFGFVIDFWNGLLPAAGNVAGQVVCMCGSVLFTALGIMLIVGMDVVPDPPTGAIQSIARAAGREIGSTKVAYDCSCLAAAALLGLLGAHALVGIGIATVVSAVCVGRVLSLLRGSLGRRLGITG